MTAVWFHAFHNAVSQVLVPKSLGIGDPRLLAESGALPVALYLAVAGVVVRNARMRRLRAVVERVRRRFLLHAFHPPPQSRSDRASALLIRIVIPSTSRSHRHTRFDERRRPRPSTAHSADISTIFPERSFGGCDERVRMHPGFDSSVHGIAESGRYNLRPQVLRWGRQ